MLDLKAAGTTRATPTDAATIVLVRDAAEGVEIFCVERNKQSRFMGGAIVFPGGKLDASDALEAWALLTTDPVPPRSTVPFATDALHLRALAIAAARETLEEAAILHVVDGKVGQEELFGLRAALESAPDALRVFLVARRLRLDLAALHPLARWITPEAESRRFDARFFVALAPLGLQGAHDERETMASFWGSPRAILARYEAGEVQLMPPTHRTITLLESCRSAADVLAFAAASNLDPICPRLVSQRIETGETMALVLPGDPEHDLHTSRIPGPSRYVLRGERWCSEDAPR